MGVSTLLFFFAKVLILLLLDAIFLRVCSTMLCFTEHMKMYTLIFLYSLFLQEGAPVGILEWLLSADRLFFYFLLFIISVYLFVNVIVMLREASTNNQFR